VKQVGALLSLLSNFAENVPLEGLVKSGWLEIKWYISAYDLY